MAKPIEFKAGTLTAMSAILREVDNVRLADALQVMMGGMGEFFAGEPTIIDLTQMKAPPDRMDWSGLTSLLRRYGLQPTAVRGAPQHLHDAVRRAGLAVLADDHGKLQQAGAGNEQVAVAEAQPAAQAAGRTILVERTVRSGQQIYARGCDLVVIGAVSNGAEVIADGSVHCYGPLRGRAIAGAQGDHEARIFSSNFGPELIAVAGVFRTFEKGIPAQIAGKAAQAILRGEADQPSLVLEPLQLN